MFNIFSNFLKKQHNFTIGNKNIDNKTLGTNSLILGKIGSGKTTSIVIPMIDYLLSENLSGIIIDIKNNLTDSVYGVAEKYNKLNDVIEIGNGSYSSNINLLNGIELNLLLKIVNDIVISNCNDKQNNYFTDKGISIFHKIIKMYYHLHEIKKVSKPTFYKLVKIRTNYNESTELFDLYKDNKDEIKNSEMMIEEIENDAFNPFKFNKSKNNSEDYHSNRLHEQLSWTIGRVVEIFKNFYNKEEYIQKFSNSEDEEFTLNFIDLLYKKNKIVVVRFYNDDSKLPKIIADFIKFKMVNDIKDGYHNFTKESGIDSKYVFNIIDEFQLAINVDSDEGYNDNHWFSISREYCNINIVATQSLSALYASSKNRNRVDAFIHNCRNKFVLTLDDPKTIHYVNELIDKKTDIRKLKQGEILYIFDDKQKNISHTIQKVDFIKYGLFHYENKEDFKRLEQLKNRLLEEKIFLIKKTLSQNSDIYSFVNENHLNVDYLENLFLNCLFLHYNKLYISNENIDVYRLFNSYEYDKGFVEYYKNYICQKFIKDEPIGYQFIDTINQIFIKIILGIQKKFNEKEKEILSNSKILQEKFSLFNEDNFKFFKPKDVLFECVEDAKKRMFQKIKKNKEKNLVFNLISYGNTETKIDFYQNVEYGGYKLKNISINEINFNRFLNYENYERLSNNNSILFINVFILGGNFEHICHSSIDYIHEDEEEDIVEELLNTKKSSGNGDKKNLISRISQYFDFYKEDNHISILALGHSKFVHPVIRKADFNVNTPSTAGLLVQEIDNYLSRVNG